MTENHLNKNETLRTIGQRRSVRLFSDRQVSQEDIIAVLEAANLAPSAHNRQSWKFIVFKGEKKKQLSEFVSSKYSEFPRPSSVLLRMASRSIFDAPVVIAIMNTGGLMKHGTELYKVNKELALDFFRTMEIQSSAAAVENLLLAATSLGLSSVWLGILYLIKDEVLGFLGEPHGEFMAVIPIGYSDKEVKSPHKKPLENIVKYL